MIVFASTIYPSSRLTFELFVLEVNSLISSAMIFAEIRASSIVDFSGSLRMTLESIYFMKPLSASRRVERMFLFIYVLFSFRRFMIAFSPLVLYKKKITDSIWRQMNTLTVLIFTIFSFVAVRV